MPDTIKFIALLAVTTASLLFSGCKKDPAGNNSHLIKTQTTTSPTGISYTINYTYDSSGRQIMAQTDTTVTTYVYSPGSVTSTITLAGVNFTTIYTTNNAGYAISDSRLFNYAYDSLGYLTGLSYTGTGNYDSTTYTILKGNSIKSVEHQADSGSNSLITIAYIYSSSAETRNFGLAWMGKANANLVSTSTETQVINGSSYNISYNYSYSFDSQGRVTQQTKTNGSSVYTTSYSYY